MCTGKLERRRKMRSAPYCRFNLRATWAPPLAAVKTCCPPDRLAGGSARRRSPARAAEVWRCTMVRAAGYLSLTLLRPRLPGRHDSLMGERWIGCRPGFFLPVRVLSRLFRRRW